MKIFNVLINDRHCDPIVHNFTDKDKAVGFARQNAKEYCRFPEDLEETECNPEKDNGWILHIQTSCEGDSVRVSEAELNE